MAERQFPAPWKVIETDGGYRVDDATGQTIGWWYGEDEIEPADRHARADASRGSPVRKGVRAAAGVAREGSETGGLTALTRLPQMKPGPA